MKGKILICACLLLLTCSCGGKFFAEETSLELYHPDGSIMAKVFSNKGYDGFDANVTFTNDKISGITWTANKINSDTVANTALEANRDLTKALTTFVNATGKLVGVAE